MEQFILKSSKRMTINKKWFLIGLLNLTFVALYGSTMRYKIAYDLPFLIQKNLLHAHSHFAFTGWVTHLLFLGLFLFISSKLTLKRRKVYHWLIGFNLFTAYGMLIFFTIQGYHAISITFSTLSIVSVLLYSYFFIKDVWKIKNIDNFKQWSIAALGFNILASAGPLSLAYIMANKIMDMSYVNSAIYFYLHFQYNGWFFFGAIALAISVAPNLPSLSNYFKIFVGATLITYTLSILWLNIPTWLYWISATAATIQLLAWGLMIYNFYPKIKTMIRVKRPIIRLLFYSSIIAITLKFVLQELSLVPTLSHFAFGVRPIIIGYLHLILLAGFTLFLIGYSFYKGFIKINKLAKISTIVFYIGVMLNELVLGVQGLAAFDYLPVPYVNQMLLLAALILLSGALGLFISQIYPDRESEYQNHEHEEKSIERNQNVIKNHPERLTKEEKILVN